MKVYVVRVTEEVRRPESQDLYLCQNYVAGAYSMADKKKFEPAQRSAAWKKGYTWR